MHVLIDAYSYVHIHPQALWLAREIHAHGITRPIWWNLTSTQVQKALVQIKNQPDLKFALTICGETPGQPAAPILSDYTYQARRLATYIHELEIDNIIGIGIGREATNYDYYKNNLDYYAQLVNHAASSFTDICPRIPVYGTTVQGLEGYEREKAFYKLRRAFVCGFDIHTYRTEKRVLEPWHNWPTREDEFKAIVEHGQRWANFETGWHSARIKKNFLADVSPCIPWGWRRFSEVDIANFLFIEAAWHQLHGADFFTIYQAYSGRGQTPDDLFGLLAPDRQSLKLRAKLLGDMLKENNFHGHNS